MKEKKLYKINEGKMIDGVCGGVAEYLGIEATIVRIIWAIISVCWGVGLVAYLICAILMPRKPENYIDV